MSKRTKPKTIDPKIRVSSLARSQLAMMAEAWRARATWRSKDLRNQTAGRVVTLAEMKTLRRCADELDSLIMEPKP
mgnify:CR=1 FL=1